MSSKLATPPRLSVVMPCLNEEAAIRACIEKARRAMEISKLSGEIIIADNGSTDRSAAIAQELGARVVHEARRGYGRAHMRGIAEARGEYVLLVDADDTYDFAAIGSFVSELERGYDLVNGNRFAGGIDAGAMPWLNRYMGNPLLSGLVNLVFRSRMGDVQCGMRAFTRAAHDRMHLGGEGMEFASEMIIQARLRRLRMTEVPVRYFPRSGPTKLHRWRDAWRSIRVILQYAPTGLLRIGVLKRRSDPRGQMSNIDT